LFFCHLFELYHPYQHLISLDQFSPEEIHTVGSLYERAVKNHDLCQLYAHLCAGKVVTELEATEGLSKFREELEDHVQGMFEKCLSSIDVQGENEKSRRAGTVVFVGHLYKEGLISNKAVHDY
ncbi:hypothetical protein PFISCL1PPCAC_12277, partial [Pristionchus fissidentatus]